jgi:hypothetical protein
MILDDPSPLGRVDSRRSEAEILPNNTFDRTAGSHALAAAGQRGR